MVTTRRYFIEITALEPFSDNNFIYAINHIFPNINVKVYQAVDPCDMKPYKH